MIYSKCRQSFGLIAVFLAIASLSAAQDYRGKVQGIVVDTNDAAIPGAQVVLRNDETGVEVTRQTNEEGRYIFDFVVLVMSAGELLADPGGWEGGSGGPANPIAGARAFTAEAVFRPDDKGSKGQR